MGIFGNLFDFNGDGKMDTFEKAAEFSAFMQMIEAEQKKENTANDLDDDDF